LYSTSDQSFTEVLDLTSWNYGGTQMIKRKSTEIINLCWCTKEKGK